MGASSQDLHLTLTIFTSIFKLRAVAATWIWFIHLLWFELCEWPNLIHVSVIYGLLLSSVVCVTEIITFQQIQFKACLFWMHSFVPIREKGSSRAGHYGLVNEWHRTLQTLGQNGEPIIRTPDRPQVWHILRCSGLLRQYVLLYVGWTVFDSS